MSDQGNQHDNGPHQDQIFDNPSALCLALWAKHRIRLGWGVGGGVGGYWCTQKALYEGSTTFCLSICSFVPCQIYSV